MLPTAYHDLFFLRNFQHTIRKFTLQTFLTACRGPTVIPAKDPFKEKIEVLQERLFGAKTPIEDAMYPMYSHCVINLNPRACSIDTPLHTLVPYQHVDHLHPNAVIAIAASVNQEKLTKEIYGDEVIYIPWQRPGFDIGLQIEQLIKDHPQARGILLGHHGMSSWSIFALSK